LPYCLLCGTHHRLTYDICIRCGLPYGYSPQTIGLPEGWEACRVNVQPIKVLDDMHELGCYEALRTTAPGQETVIKRTQPFVYELWWDEYNEPPPPMTEEMNLHLDALSSALQRDGWIPTTINDGSRSKEHYWRRTARGK